MKFDYLEVNLSLTKNLKIGPRLFVGFLLVSAISLYLAGLGKYNFSDLASQAEDLTKDSLVKVQITSEIKENTNLVAQSVRNLALLKNANDIAIERKHITEARSSTADLISKTKVMVLSKDETVMVRKITDAQSPYDNMLDRFIELTLKKTDIDYGELLVKDLGPLQNNYFKSIDTFYDYEKQQMRFSLEQLKSDAATDSTWFIVVALGGLVIGLTVAWFIAHSIIEPIQESIKIARKIADGNLSADIQTDRQDEAGDLIRALKAMNESLSRIVGQVRNSGEKVAAGSNKVAGAGVNLSQRTEEQAASLEQTASAMEELASAVKKNTDTALQANNLAPMSIKTVREGGLAVDQVIGTIEDISASSQQMSGIIGVIDGIAFQTSILSLNAAVEAAKAGEQGKGFAVVATEVRLLAQRSANAAKRIKDLISSNIENVHTCAKQVEVAKVGMNRIVDQVTQVGVLIKEISASSQQQSAGITEISSAVSQLDRVTQRNAVLVEENAAAAKGLNAEAEELLRSVSTFTLA